MTLSRTALIIVGASLVLVGAGVEIGVLAGLERGVVRVGVLSGAMLNRLVTVLTVVGSGFVVAGLVLPRLGARDGRDPS